MGKYSLTKAADADLDAIFDYGIDIYGLENAIIYQHAIEQRFLELVKYPFMYPAIDDICIGYRRSVFGINSIFYRVTPKEIVIVRILGQQDPLTALNET